MVLNYNIIIAIGERMGKEFWNEKVTQRLLKRNGDAKRKLSLLEGRQQLGVNLVTGVPDEDILFIARSQASFTHLDLRRYQAVVEGEATALRDASTALARLECQLQGYETKTRETQDAISQLLDRVRAAALTLGTN